jgi:hypothetical protein
LGQNIQKQQIMEKQQIMGKQDIIPIINNNQNNKIQQIQALELRPNIVPQLQTNYIQPIVNEQPIIQQPNQTMTLPIITQSETNLDNIFSTPKIKLEQKIESNNNSNSGNSNSGNSNSSNSRNTSNMYSNNIIKTNLNDFDNNDELGSPYSPHIKLEDKPYGCLKSGNKPTYRSWNKTIKSSHNSTRFSNSNEIHNIVDENKHHKKHRHHKIRRVLRKTTTRKFKLGKHGNVVGVLIKNNETRKKVQKEQGILKRKSLHDIKKYLVGQKLLKIGSNAPNDVIRKMYEDSILTGEVENVGKGIILHNFLKEDKPW